jgi:hypothetical protein
MERELLAWRKYPEPNGTNYYRKDLQTPMQVESLFDYCQIWEATIFGPGWQFLLDRYGWAGLFEINQRSGWFDSESPEEFEIDVRGYWQELGFEGCLNQ